MAKRLDQSKPYSLVRGITGVAFEQDETFFNRLGQQVAVVLPVITETSITQRQGEYIIKVIED